MDGNYQSVLSWIRRKLEILVSSTVYGAVITRNSYISCTVIAAWWTDSIKYVLIELVYSLDSVDTIAVWRIYPPFILMSDKSWLVHSLKYELVVIVLEAVGYLWPYSCHILFWLLIMSRIGIHIFQIVIMVNIEDHVHTVVDSVINDFLNSVHPLLGYIIASVNVIVPWNGDPYSSEACGFNSVYHFLWGLVAAVPAGLDTHFTADPACVVNCVHSVSEVPAEAHILYEIDTLCVWDILWGDIQLGNGICSRTDVTIFGKGAVYIYSSQSHSFFITAAICKRRQRWSKGNNSDKSCTSFFYKFIHCTSSFHFY